MLQAPRPDGRPSNQAFQDLGGANFTPPQQHLYARNDLVLEWGVARGGDRQTPPDPLAPRPVDLTHEQFPTAVGHQHYGPNHCFEIYAPPLLGHEGSHISSRDVTALVAPGHNILFAHQFCVDQDVLRDQAPRCPDHQVVMKPLSVKRNAVAMKYVRSMTTRRARDHRLEYR